jgi:HEAT repeat protein
VPLFLRPPNVEKLAAKADVMGLVRASRYKDPAVAEQARQALIDQLDHLVQNLQSKNMSVLEVSREALVAIGPEARDRLIFILGKGHVHRRQDAAFVLGRMRDPEAVEPLAKALAHPDPLLRSLAAQALGRIGDPGAAKPLRRMLALENDGAVKREARKALGKLAGEPPS